MQVQFTSHKAEVLSAVEKAAAKGLEICGGVAEGYAAKLSPVDTGRLRASITHQMDGDDAVYIGTNVEYAPHVELGTSRMSAQPYLRPAIENHVDEYKEIINRELMADR